MPAVDAATGIYTYSYTDTAGNPLLAGQILGQMLVDYSSGIVRFTQPFSEIRNANGSYATVNVYAQYTPQTWRLTTDEAADSSPRAFIDHTPMTLQACPGLQLNTTQQNSVNGGNGAMDSLGVDRLWVFWRKSGTGVGSSTIWYKTYRMGVDLTTLKGWNGKPIVWNQPDSNHVAPYVDSDNITLTNHSGPYEVDRTGTRLYFTEADERYDSLINAGASDALGAGPGPMQLTYTAGDGSVQKLRLPPEIPSMMSTGSTSCRTSRWRGRPCRATSTKTAYPLLPIPEML